MNAGHVLLLPEPVSVSVKNPPLRKVRCARDDRDLMTRRYPFARMLESATGGGIGFRREVVGQEENVH